MKLIAVAHSGKMGDSLFVLPTIKRLCEIHGAKADFYVRSFCEPMRDLVEYQPYINRMRTDGKYTEAKPRFQGISEVREGEKYESFYDISWPSFPLGPLPEIDAELAGLPRDVGRNLHYDIPEGLTQRAIDVLMGRKEYVVIVSRQGAYRHLFDMVVEKAPWPVIVMGRKTESLTFGADLTGMGFLDMARVIAGAKSFIGNFSSPLVVAQGFEIPKTCVFNGTEWNPMHIIMDGETQYLVNPTVEQVIESANRKLRVKRVWE